MIVSASYRTDIPAFYSEWFLRRLAEGACQAINPWNRKPYEISLLPKDVDGFVFWTRNLSPLSGALESVSRIAPFYVQYTITGYPRALERSVIDVDRAIASIVATHAQFGPRAVVWRYDPIVFSSLTPSAWHTENFQSIAGKLRGMVDEVTISFAQIYRKTQRNLDAAAQQSGFNWVDPEEAEKHALVGEFTRVAATTGMRLTVCSQAKFLTSGVEAAACIDAGRLSAVAGQTITAPVKGNRPECLCHQSRDIGAYDTCPHGCAYCYAVAQPERAKARHAAHISTAPAL